MCELFCAERDNVSRVSCRPDSQRAATPPKTVYSRRPLVKCSRWLGRVARSFGQCLSAILAIEGAWREVHPNCHRKEDDNEKGDSDPVNKRKMPCHHALVAAAAGWCIEYKHLVRDLTVDWADQSIRRFDVLDRPRVCLTNAFWPKTGATLTRNITPSPRLTK